MDHAEKVAKIILEAALPGAVMTFRPVQSNMEHDFDLRYPNGEVAAVEVTSSRNQILTQTNAEIFNKKKGGTVIKAVKCKKSWYIFPSPGAQINEIRKNVDKYLAELEAAELGEFDFLRMHLSPKCSQDICNDLNLTMGIALASTEAQPEIHIAGVGGGGALDATTAIYAGQKEANSNKEKLGKAGTNERHLVVYIDQMNGLAWTALTEFEPPSALPNLPDEITHIWLATEYGKTDQFAIWYGSKTESWRRIVLPANVDSSGANSTISPLSQ
jgi:hypothetical protein